MDSKITISFFFKYLETNLQEFFKEFKSGDLFDFTGVGTQIMKKFLSFNTLEFVDRTIFFKYLFLYLLEAIKKIKANSVVLDLGCNDGSLGNKLWELVREAGLEFNIVPIAPNSTRSIEGGLLSYQSDIRRKHSPYAVNLDRLVDLDQDINFIGKEALKIIKNV